jgi:hypothetical protein
VVADEGKADDANSLENPRLDEREAFGGITFEEGRDERALVYDGEYDDKHAAEGETGGNGEFVDVAV